MQIRKTIAAVHGENTTLILYEILRAPSAFSLELQPFIAFRNFHSLIQVNNSIRPDVGEQPEYNTVDATLWYFVAIYKYLQDTGDTQFVRDELMPVLHHLIEWHERGTRY